MTYSLTDHAKDRIAERFPNDRDAVCAAIRVGPLYWIADSVKRGEEICHIALRSGLHAYPVVFEGRILTVLSEGMDTYTSCGIRFLREGDVHER